MHSTRLTIISLSVALALALVPASGCDKREADAADKADGTAEPAQGGEAAQGGAATEVDVRTFLKDQRKKGCEMLPPATVAEILEVPEGELRQMKIAGCNYSWTSADESQSAEASINAIWVKEDAAKARQHFDNSTKDSSADEVKAQLGAVMSATKQRDEVDSETKEKAVEQVGGMVAAMVPDAGYQYDDVPGVGDAARVLEHDGAVTVLVGNMVFSVRAYKGASQPPLDMAGIKPTDTDALMALAKQAETEWLAKTRDLRKQHAIALAKAIIADL